MNPGVFVMGGGGAGGGSGGKGGSGSGGEQGANGENGGDGADGAGGCAGSSGAECTIHQSNPSAGDPIELSTGRVFTLPETDVRLNGPMVFQFVRQYSSKANERDVGLGHGWSHSFAFRLRKRRRALEVTTPEGKSVSFPMPTDGDDMSMSTDGWALWPEAGGYSLDAQDGKLRHFRSLTDDSGRELVLWSVRDMNLNTIELGYDRGLLVQATDAAKRTVLFRRGPDGRITSIDVKNARAQGRWVKMVSYAYDDRGDLVRVTDADGYETCFSYDDRHRLILAEYPTQLRFHYRYRPDGRCHESWGDYRSGNDPSLSPDVPAFLADGVTPARGVHHVKLHFDDDGYVEVADSVQVLRFFMNAAGFAEKSVSAGGVTTRTFDAFGYLTSITDPEGATTTYQRDYRGRVLCETDPLGRTTTYDRDHRGLPVEITEPDGTVHRYRYDDRGNMIERVDTKGGVTRYLYDDRGLMVERIHPNGARDRFGYDADGNLVSRVERDGPSWTFEYDALGRIFSVKSALGAEVRCAHTDGGRLHSIFDADGGVTRLTHDGGKRLKEVVKPDGGVIRYEYGGLDRLVALHHANGDVERYLYNREGWCVEVRNPAAEPYRYAYDLQGLERGEDAVDGHFVRYTRDFAGRVVAIENSLGERFELEYNAAGELVKQILPDGSEEIFEYDVMGRPIAMGNAAGTFMLQRDAMGNVVRETQVVDGHAVVLDHDHDQVHNPTRTRCSLGWVEELERDPSGRRIKSVLNGVHQIVHTNDAMGREISRAFNQGGRLDIQFDVVGHVAGLRVSSPDAEQVHRRPDEPAWLGDRGGATLVREFEWTLGDDLVSVNDPLRKVTDHFEYDRRHRLTRRRRDQALRSEYRYDASNNRYEAATHLAYAPGNRLIERDDTRYRYDALGRMIEKRRVDAGGAELVWGYDWNPAGRLARVRRPDGAEVVFTYDPLGRRVTKRELRRDGSITPTVVTDTRYVWSGDVMVHEIRRQAVAGGDPIVEERTYSYADTALSPWAQRVVRSQGGTQLSDEWHAYVVDPSGMPLALVDDAGRVVTSFERSDLGGIEAAEGPVDTPFRLHGQFYDDDTGLSYNWYRYYDPETGRYISPDPIGLGGGFLNLYAFGNNPITDEDPYGLHGAQAWLSGRPLTDRYTGSRDYHSGYTGDHNRDDYLRRRRSSGAESTGSLYAKSHSEMKILRQVAAQNSREELRGRTLRIKGESRSCPNCAKRIEEFAQRNEMKVVYQTEGSEDLVCDFRPGRSSTNRAAYSRATAASYR